jgi:nitrite reductase/ring-hydroxylating ferredoxin subunit
MLDELPDGKGRAFTWGAGKQAYGIIVLRLGDAVTAFVNTCPHFQIPLDHAAKITTFREFVLCSHHYAAFRMSDGYCVEGPCEGATLTPVPIAVDDGCISIASRSPGS